MYEYIQGTLVELSPSKVVIEACGIGYSLLIPAHSYVELLGSIGQSIKCFLSHVLREDSERFFGFLKKNERDAFEKLSEISGIGPKTALSIVGHLSLKELALAIQAQDALTLAKIPGIGKKTAERLLVEIKDKLKSLIAEASSLEPLPKEHLALLQDAVSALTNLGYPQSSAHLAAKYILQQSPPTLKLAELITLSLKKLRAKD
ncbi:MAG: Holliday junction branch migration protein RuvA [Chlamydiae bacterium]|nr:Holliday junction branch migration protein RuvA [Chlamydiota bacterium]